MYFRISLSNPRAKFDRPRSEIEPFQAEVQYGGLRDSGAANPQKLSRMWFSVDVIKAWVRLPKRGLQTMFSTSHALGGWGSDDVPIQGNARLTDEDSLRAFLEIWRSRALS